MGLRTQSSHQSARQDLTDVRVFIPDVSAYISDFVPFGQPVYDKRIWVFIISYCHINEKILATGDHKTSTVSGQCLPLSG